MFPITSAGFVFFFSTSLVFVQTLPPPLTVIPRSGSSAGTASISAHTQHTSAHQWEHTATTPACKLRERVSTQPLLTQVCDYPWAHRHVQELGACARPCWSAQPSRTPARMFAQPRAPTRCSRRQTHTFCKREWKVRKLLSRGKHLACYSQSESF